MIGRLTMVAIEKRFDGEIHRLLVVFLGVRWSVGRRVEVGSMQDRVKSHSS